MSPAEPGADARAERRGRGLLVLGAALGIALSAFGLVEPGGGRSSLDDAVAIVNGQPLPRDAFERFVAAVAAERKLAVLPLEERQRLLDRLVDEELLLQHGIGLGLARHEPTARRMIVQSVIAAVTGAAEARPPEEAELRAWYGQNGERFVRPGRFGVEALAVGVGERSDDEARALAARAAQALGAGEAAASVRRALPGVEPPPLPGGPLPLETLRRYLGPTAALRAQELAVGEVSDPFRTAAGYLVLRLESRTPDVVPPFEEVVESVRAEWLRAQGEAALARFLAELREAAEIETAELDGAPPAGAR